MRWWRRSTAPGAPASTEMDRPPDEAPALMARYCAGDLQAFRALYDLLAPLVVAELAGHDAFGADANALLEATFLALHRDRSAYVRGADPRPWVTALARETVQSALRSNAARRLFGANSRDVVRVPA